MYVCILDSACLIYLSVSEVYWLISFVYFDSACWVYLFSRSALVDQMESEDQHRQKCYEQLEMLSNKLDSIPLSDTVSIPLLD